MKKAAKSIFIFLLTWFCIHISYIITDGLTSKPESSEYAVIFGTTVHKNGEMSARLKARVDKGFELYNKGLARKLFVSGGLGKEGHFEAQVMASYLINKGVTKNDIIVDDTGINTWQTVLNFYQQCPRKTSLIVVSQYFHLTRAKMAFRKFDALEVSAAHADYYELRDGYSLFREFFGFYKYLLVY